MRLKGDGSGKYSPGIFLWLPFTHFEYILPDDNKVDERVVRVIEKGAIIVCVKEG
ncbi:MAG: hypothetical protein HZB80_01795 [Deltaproteobacteria bacterium]|nr:hypothetical protein [Deltaproteobacteria bacterium]